MRGPRMVTIESHRLSDDTLAEVSRFGRTYSFMHTTNEWGVAPHTVINISKSEAMTLLADTLRDDVLELDS